MQITAEQLAKLINGTIEGDATATVSSFAKIEEATQGTLTFLANPKYEQFIYDTKASIVLVKKDFEAQAEVTATMIRVDDPYATLAMLLNYVNSMTTKKRTGIEPQTQIHESVNIPESCFVGSFTYIAEGASIGENACIYPQCYIGENVKIGENVTLFPGVKIYHDCVIGNNVTIHAGTVVGGDGFGFAPNNGAYMKIAQIGNVIIEDNVEIGSNTTIDRATMGSTIIRKGVKLDNLIQVAHNVEIGENTVMAAQVGIAGSTKIGSNIMVGGQVGFAGHIKVADGSQFGAQSGVHNHITQATAYLGSPAIPAKEYARQFVYLKNIGDLTRQVRTLQKEIDKLKNNK